MTSWASRHVILPPHPPPPRAPVSSSIKRLTWTVTDLTFVNKDLLARVLPSRSAAPGISELPAIGCVDSVGPSPSVFHLLGAHSHITGFSRITPQVSSLHSELGLTTFAFGYFQV